jgi:hypothetical protein
MISPSVGRIFVYENDDIGPWKSITGGDMYLIASRVYR